MKYLKIVTLLFVMAVFSATALPQTNPDNWNQKTILTFNEPVEVPGVVLPPGTYVFKLADNLTDRNIVQVFNKEENHLIATFLAIPDYRFDTTPKTAITFEERSQGSPHAIKAWFYPGDTFGHEFVYPASRATEMATATQPEAPSTPPAMAESVTKPEEPVEAQAPEPAPSENETQSAEVQPQMTPSEPSAPTQPAEQLPKTASPLPWLLLIGTVSLFVSLAFRIGSKRTS
jgi:hypothetical protein